MGAIILREPYIMKKNSKTTNQIQTPVAAGAWLDRHFLSSKTNVLQECEREMHAATHNIKLHRPMLCSIRNIKLLIGDEDFLNKPEVQINGLKSLINWP